MVAPSGPGMVIFHKPVLTTASDSAMWCVSVNSSFIPEFGVMTVYPSRMAAMPRCTIASGVIDTVSGLSSYSAATAAPSPALNAATNCSSSAAAAAIIAAVSGAGGATGAQAPAAAIAVTRAVVIRICRMGSSIWNQMADRLPHTHHIPCGTRVCARRTAPGSFTPCGGVRPDRSAWLATPGPVWL